MPYAVIQNMYDSLTAEKQKEVYDFICFLVSTSKDTEESLEDKEDYETAVAAWEEYEQSGRKSYSSAELREEFGL